MPLHGIDPIIELNNKIRYCSIPLWAHWNYVGCIGIRYMMIIDWPMNIWVNQTLVFTRTYFIIRSYLFEFTVLCAAHGMAITYLLRNKTLPGTCKKSRSRTTDDKFIIEIKSSENAHIRDKKLSDLIKSTGFVEIEEKILT